MNSLDLRQVASDLLKIDIELPFRIGKRGVAISDFDLETFEQWWGSTTGGFPGVGGSAITMQRTYVLVSKRDDVKSLVFFGGRFAYSTYGNSLFFEDIEKRNMVSVGNQSKYEV